MVITGRYQDSLVAIVVIDVEKLFAWARNVSISWKQSLHEYSNPVIIYVIYHELYKLAKQHRIPGSARVYSITYVMQFGKEFRFRLLRGSPCLLDFKTEELSYLVVSRLRPIYCVNVTRSSYSRCHSPKWSHWRTTKTFYRTLRKSRTKKARVDELFFMLVD